MCSIVSAVHHILCACTGDSVNMSFASWCDVSSSCILNACGCCVLYRIRPNDFLEYAMETYIKPALAAETAQQHSSSTSSSSSDSYSDSSSDACTNARRRALDLGCGNGRDTVYMAQVKTDVTHFLRNTVHNDTIAITHMRFISEGTLCASATSKSSLCNSTAQSLQQAVRIVSQCY
jgi:Tellurite resistance protein TehB